MNRKHCTDWNLSMRPPFLLQREPNGNTNSSIANVNLSASTWTLTTKGNQPKHWEDCDACVCECSFWRIKRGRGPIAHCTRCFTDCSLDVPTLFLLQCLPNGNMNTSNCSLQISVWHPRLHTPFISTVERCSLGKHHWKFHALQLDSNGVWYSEGAV